MPPRSRCGACQASQKFCDKQRPSCSRCQAKGTACVYRSRECYEFVDQNRFSAELSRRADRRHQRVAKRGGSHALNPSAAMVGMDSTTLLWTVDHRVLTRFFARWAAGFTCLANQRFLWAMHERAGRDSALQLAVRAAAYADLTVADRHGDHAIRSYVAYSAAIHQINALCEQPFDRLVTDNALLAAVLVVDSVELLYMCRGNPLGIHTQAVVRLLQLRNQSAARDQFSVDLERVATPRLQARRIMSEQPYLDESVGRCITLGTFPLDQHVTNVIGRACALIARFEAARVVDVSRTASLREELVELLLHDEPQGEGPVPRLRRVRIRPSESTSPYAALQLGTSVLVADRAWIARDWILLQMCRVRILEILLESLPRQPSQPESDEVPVVDPLLPVIGSCSAYLNECCRFLLDAVPHLIGLVDSDGGTERVPLRDMGLLISHYPLWRIRQSRHAAPHTLREASRLLDFVKHSRSILGRIPVE